MENFTIEDVAEEIELSLGLKTKKNGRKYYAETIAGDVEITMYVSLMASYYRFIMAYGYKLSKYGLSNKLKEETGHTNQKHL